MKAHLLVFAGLLVVSCSVWAQDESPFADTIVGVWQTESGAYIQIFDAGDSYAGKVVGSTKGQPRYDVNNPDPAKQGRPLLGVTLLHDVEYTGDLTWGGGQIYAPKKGETYDVEAALRNPDTLKVRAYVGIRLLGKSQIWTAVPLDAPNLVNKLLVDHPKGTQQAAAAQDQHNDTPTD